MSRDRFVVLRSAVILVAALHTGALLDGAVTFSRASERDACTVITLPRWKAAPRPSPSYDWSHVLLALPNLSDWDFRQLDGGILVGLFTHAESYKPEWRSYSPDKYAVSLPSGHVQKASNSVWDNAEPDALIRDAKLLTGAALKPNAPLALGGDVYQKKGAKWPTAWPDSARVSQDGAFLALNSWDGEMWSATDIPGLGGGRIDGDYYVDIYDIRSKRLALSLTGHFHNVPVDNLFGISAWISNRYYLFPLNEEASHFVICDMKRISAPEGEKKR
jgi:hypothetical protein